MLASLNNMINLSILPATSAEEEKDDILISPPQRIVGGDDVTANTYPWFTMLTHIDNGVEYEQGCGGMLVAPEWVLTANHCIDDNMRNGGAVRIGALSSPFQVGDNGGQNIEFFLVSRVVEHPNYDPSTLDYDFTLLCLNGVSRIDPVPLDSDGLSETYATGKKY